MLKGVQRKDKILPAGGEVGRLNIVKMSINEYIKHDANQSTNKMFGGTLRKFWKSKGAKIGPFVLKNERDLAYPTLRTISSLVINRIWGFVETYRNVM